MPGVMTEPGSEGFLNDKVFGVGKEGDEEEVDGKGKGSNEKEGDTK